MTRRRRSVSSPLAGISTFSGAPPGAVFGMSWIWPSVMAMVPASRERGMSASARSITLNSRVPASPCSGTVMVRSSRSGSFAACAAIGGAGCLGQLGAVADLHRGGLVHHQQPDIGQRLAGFLHQARAGQPQQQHGKGAKPQDGAARAPRRGERHDQRRENAERGDQPHRQQRIEAQRGDGLFGMHL